MPWVHPPWEDEQASPDWRRTDAFSTCVPGPRRDFPSLASIRAPVANPPSPGFHAAIRQGIILHCTMAPVRSNDPRATHLPDAFVLRPIATAVATCRLAPEQQSDDTAFTSTRGRTQHPAPNEQHATCSVSRRNPYRRANIM